MKKYIFLTTLLSVSLLTFNYQAFAKVYLLPPNNSKLIGKNLEINVPKDNKLSLEDFASRYQIGLSNMLEANPGIDVYLPQRGSKLIIPQQLILPDAPRKGIIINNPEMRLYYYPKGTNTVVVLPIGIGEFGKDTPINWITTVLYKKANPTWIPTKKMHEEYIAHGEKLKNIFPPGPNNPMGLYALYIGRLYAIHGTNANFGIGLRISHGCVRLRSDDIKWLYTHVPVGTRVQFVNQAVKATIEPNGSRYIEIHNPLSITEEQYKSLAPTPITLTHTVSKIITEIGVNQKIVNQALKTRSGLPILINSKTEMQ